MTVARKGILLAGGSGTRLYPATRVVSKHLLPIYDKPMIYYSLSVLMLAGIRDIIIVTTPGDLEDYRRLLGDGHSVGISIRYAPQPAPRGLADALLAAEREYPELSDAPLAVILGDNLYYGDHLTAVLQRAGHHSSGATILLYPVENPHDFGIAHLDAVGNIVSVEEKPAQPTSNFAITGLYFYDQQLFEIARNLKPSARGELEITDIHREYLHREALRAEHLDDTITWFDAGTPSTLAQAANFVATTQHRRATQIGCIEELAYRLNYIPASQLAMLAKDLPAPYGEYLLRISASSAVSSTLGM